MLEHTIRLHTRETIYLNLSLFTCTLLCLSPRTVYIKLANFIFFSLENDDMESSKRCVKFLSLFFIIRCLTKENDLKKNLFSITKYITSITSRLKPSIKNRHFTPCHPPGVKNGLIKGEVCRLPRTNSSKTTFEEALSRFKALHEQGGYPKHLIERTPSEVNFSAGQLALKQKAKTSDKILVRTYNPAANLKTILTRLRLEKL